MNVNFEFRQNYWFASEPLSSRESFMTFDVDFKQLRIHTVLPRDKNLRCWITVYLNASRY